MRRVYRAISSLMGIIVVLVGLSSCRSSAAYSPEVEEALDDLDRLIERREFYIGIRETRLEQLKVALDDASEPGECFDLILQLSRDYRPYRFDSAFHYAQSGIEMGGTLGPRETRAALIETAYCYLSAGLFFEAGETIDRISREGLSPEEAVALHRLQMKNYLDMAEYNDHNAEIADKYRRLGLAQADSVLTLLPEGSREWYLARIHQRIHQYRLDEARETIEEFLLRDDITDRERAIALSLEGSVAAKSHDDNAALRALAQSAAYDIVSGTRETTSMARLATQLYLRGDIDRAARYIDIAMEDANFYDAKHRKTSIADIRPLIEQSRLQSAELRRQQMVRFTVALSILCLLLLAAIVVIIVQMRHLRHASDIIVDKNRELAQSNDRLEEANTIKDEYIGSSFYRQGDYINEQEELYRFILKALEREQYSAIKKRLKQSEVVRERKDMYADFDETFTHLFPTFVEEYNKLFPPETQEEITPGSGLTPEMRIFALIRVGITKTEQIARFLNYSVNTINTYKTRVKNKSLVENKDFESEIMKIGHIG